MMIPDDPDGKKNHVEQQQQQQQQQQPKTSVTSHHEDSINPGSSSSSSSSSLLRAASQRLKGGGQRRSSNSNRHVGSNHHLTAQTFTLGASDDDLVGMRRHNGADAPSYREIDDSDGLVGRVSSSTTTGETKKKSSWFSAVWKKQRQSNDDNDDGVFMGTTTISSSPINQENDVNRYSSHTNEVAVDYAPMVDSREVIRTSEASDCRHKDDDKEDIVASQVYSCISSRRHAQALTASTRQRKYRTDRTTRLSPGTQRGAVVPSDVTDTTSSSCTDMHESLLQQQPTVRHSSTSTRSTIRNTTSTALSSLGGLSSLMLEEAIQQDCAFFYQQPPSSSASPSSSMSATGKGHRGRRRQQQQQHQYYPQPHQQQGLVSADQLQQQQQERHHPYPAVGSVGVFRTLLPNAHQATYSYGRNCVHVLSPPVLSHYRSKYQQLNTTDHDSYNRKRREYRDGSEAGRRRYLRIASVLDAILPDYDDGYDYDDDDLGRDLELQVEEEGEGEHDERRRQRSNRSIIASNDAVERSNLLYKHNGRLLLKLPQDQVRLIMDPDLPVGSLSVEQWRKPPTAVLKRETSDGSCTQNDGVIDGEESMPPSLHYVLCVPDDLYRRLIGELSDELTETNCGCRHSDSGSKKVDIRVAIFIMSIAMLILFFTTIEWPTD